MKMFRISVVRAGPPPVVACTTSKPFMEPSSAVATLKVTAGASSGDRIFQKVRQREAPSMRADSTMSSGIVLRPAR